MHPGSTDCQSPVMTERELVERLAAIGWKGSRAVLLGPGDDAAVLRGGFTISTDIAVEGVHFRFDWVSAEEAGFRAGAAALSDLAAMGAVPLALLVSMAVPGGGDHAVALDLQRGVRRAGDRVGVAIIGGDVSRSRNSVVLDVVVVGKAAGYVSRGGAEPAQQLWVSGSLGGARAAVDAWLAGKPPDPAARIRFAAPPNRIPLGGALAGRGIARSMIDLSDGLILDAGRVAAMSGARICIRSHRVPVDPGAGGDLNLALVGGEDYELMFTANPGTEPRILALGQELSVPLTRIGMVEAGTGVVLEDERGRRTDPGDAGFDHFATPLPDGLR